MSTPAGNRYTEHRQQGFAAKDQAGNYLFRCVCGWTSGYVTSEDGKRALRLHVATSGGNR